MLSGSGKSCLLCKIMVTKSQTNDPRKAETHFEFLHEILKGYVLTDRKIFLVLKEAEN